MEAVMKSSLSKEFLISIFSELIPQNRIIFDANIQYGQCTTGATRMLTIGLQVLNETEIQGVLELANKYRISVYPISTGRNWGYGTALPVTDNNIILDLSKMNQILEVNYEMGWVRIQPGVTQYQLRDYFDTKGYDFIVPTTGAGPNCSLLGNLVERGYGITPIQDHFESLLALNAVLPNGEKYHSILKDIAGDEIHHNFKWGLGPYFDALFAQSNYGIVTEATIALVRNSERVEIFVIEFDEDSLLLKAVEFIRETRKKMGTLIGGINLINQHRMLSMKSNYPTAPEDFERGLISNKTLEKLSKQHAVRRWTIVGAIYGPTIVVQSAKKIIKKDSAWANRQNFLNPRRISKIQLIAQWLPDFFGKKKIQSILDTLKKLSDILEGRPSDVALALVYWKSKYKPKNLSAADFTKTGSGLIWYSPLVLIQSERVQEYLHFVTQICYQYQMEPLITLTSISERCFDSTVPLLFDRDNPIEKENAEACYETLLSEGKKLGFFPYRLGVNSMKYLTSYLSQSFDLNHEIKKIVDPNQILAPGRYSEFKTNSL
jgi:4-cresol dehydrogenase (hydroxylating)